LSVNQHVADTEIIQLETDYLVVGAGAMGLAFIDELMTRDSSARVIVVDKHAKPGGHWNDAYSFVSLHQPAAYYGVNSEMLGNGGAALASGREVLVYFERVLRKLTATGRLRYYPMCDYLGDGRFKSTLMTHSLYEVHVRKKTVDATYMKVEVPAICPPRYEVADGVQLIPIGGLVHPARDCSGYVVIGAGKTGMDAALFLLEQGVAPSQITWIMPNDAWLLDRAHIQPGKAADNALGAQLECFAGVKNLEQLCLALEAKGQVLRLDLDVWPTKYRCATVNREELQQLRRIDNVVRLGRVVRIERDVIVLERGEILTDARRLHVDCTADGLAKREIKPVFSGDHITLQSLFMCQQVFSASLIGMIEAKYSDDAEKNGFCTPVPHPEFTRDLVTATIVSLSNASQWGRRFPIWLLLSRLFLMHHEPLLKLLWNGIKARRNVSMANERLQFLSQQKFPDEVSD